MKYKKRFNNGIQPTSVETWFGFGFCLLAGRLMHGVIHKK